MPASSSYKGHILEDLVSSCLISRFSLVAQLNLEINCSRFLDRLDNDIVESAEKPAAIYSS